MCGSVNPEEPGDPRYAPDIATAARNPDGTWNGVRALAWMSEALNPGHGLSEAEVAKIAQQTIMEARKK